MPSSCIVFSYSAFLLPVLLKFSSVQLSSRETAL